MNEGIICIILIFPHPWPPSIEAILISKNVKEGAVYLLADEKGRLIVRIVNKQTLVCVFQPLEIKELTKGIVTITWSNGNVSAFLNGIPLCADCPGIPPFIVKGNKVEIIPTRSAILPPICLIQTDNETERFFLETLKDIETKVLDGTRYSLIRAAGLLRQIFLDSHSLINIVNRKYRIKLTFRVNNNRLPPPIEMDIQWCNLDPTQLSTSNCMNLNRDDFLQSPCIRTKDGQVSVRDVISACANAMGGVHMGSARTPQEQTVLDIDETISMLGEKPSLSALSGLCWISLHAMLPLVTAIQDVT